MQQPLVVLDCERMRHPNTGLFHFCWHLAETIPHHLPSGYRFKLYLPKHVDAGFDKGLSVVAQQLWHKLYLQPANSASLWHCTNQLSDYFPFSSRCKVVLNVHDLNFLYDANKSAAKKNRYLKQVNAKLKRADAIVAISEYVRQDLLKHTGAAPEKISVVYNGCNINQALVPVRPAQVPAAPFFFTIGTIVDKKNFHVLPGILTGNDYYLVIAGIAQSEGYKNRIVEAARKLGVADRIIFTGPVSEAEKYWYLQQCAAFVFPSLSEGFGLPVIEAMYFGKPALLSRATSLPEIGGAYAYYFESFEPAHMSRLAAEAIHDVHINNKAAAIQNWASRFNWEEAAATYSRIYQNLLS